MNKLKNCFATPLLQSGAIYTAILQLLLKQRLLLLSNCEGIFKAYDKPHATTSLLVVSRTSGSWTSG
jgi:hypothetical protein